MTTDTRRAPARTHVGVRYADAGPISYCSPGDLILGVGDYVIVRGNRGERLGWVVVGADQVLGNLVDGPSRVIDRLAAESDVTRWRNQTERAKADILRVQTAVVSRIDARVRVANITYDLEHTYGELTYTANEFHGEERLHRDAAQFLEIPNLEIEQVGDRDRAKALGGLGQCGRGLCCSTWMTEFPAISIKMAKDQGLAPNPSKISGACGRLLCCLAFEVDAYREIVGTLPKVGKRITTPIGKAKVISINAINETVRLRMDETDQVIELGAETIRQQMGTAIRPEELDADVEENFRREDEERRALFLAALEPTDRRAPRRSSRAAFDAPGREVRDERPLRDLDAAAVPDDRTDEPRAPRPLRQRPAASNDTARPRRDAPPSGGTRSRRDGDARPARDGAPRDAGRERPPRDDAPRTERTTIGGIRVTRRAARPADAAGSATPRPARVSTSRDTAPRPPRTEARSETPRPPSDGTPGTEVPGESEEQRRRRRRGRRGGRGRGASDGADSGSAPDSGTDE